MAKEIKYKKYDLMGSNFHYNQIKKSIFRGYNAYLYARYKVAIDLIKHIISPLKKKQVEIRLLDIGCGDGVLINLLNNELKDSNIKMYGVDSAENAIIIAKKMNPSVIFEVSNVYKLPFNSNNFDIVISSDLIEHLREPEKMLSEIKRVGKNESYIVIGTPIRYTEVPHHVLHQHEFFPNEFKMILSNYFERVRIIKSHKLKYLLLYNRPISLCSRNSLIIRYVINFLSIYLKKNPFLNNKENSKDLYSYMFGTGKISK